MTTKKTKATTAAEPQAAQPAMSTNDGAQLTINDLVAMKSIIDIASQRGTFKPNEMTVVGQTYTKLDVFLEAIKEQQNSTQEQ